MVAIVARSPNHKSTLTFLPSSTNSISTDKCLNVFFNVPRGPVTVITRDLIDTATGKNANNMSPN